MTDLLDLGWRLRRLVFTLLACAALAACGPGTGGTGTGPVQGVLTFSGSAGPAFSASPPASCVGDCGQVTLRLEEEAVELKAPCLRFVHNGAWSIDAARLAVVAGTVETATTAGPRSQSATLRLQFTDAPEASRQVTFILLDAEGRALLAPVSLDRRDGASAPGVSSCTN